MRHGQRRHLAPDGTDIGGLTTVETDTLVKDATAHGVALHIVVVALHHSLILILRDLGVIGNLRMFCEILLLEVLENLFEGFGTLLLL